MSGKTAILPNGRQIDENSLKEIVLSLEMMQNAIADILGNPRKHPDIPEITDKKAKIL